jgi:hypothetical protein
VKKLAIILAFCGALGCSSVHAKTFVGVLYPLFGPGAAIGLVELVDELKAIPDVEVSTYLHQSWSSLVEDIDHQPPGTHIVVIGYSLGANNSVLVANQAKYVDLIIALQPSMLTSTPPISKKVGRVIEIYNPNPWMTFGGMGSQRLVGENIEYIENNDSHPGAQFDPQFRDLAKTEVAKLADEDRPQVARAKMAKPVVLAQLQPDRLAPQHSALAAKDHLKIALAQTPKAPKLAKTEDVAQETPQQQQGELLAFAALPGPVPSGEVFTQRQLTTRDMKDYVQRTYHSSPPSGLAAEASN